MNIPFTELSGKTDKLEQYKNKPVFVYGFGTAPETFKAAQILADKGFNKVSVLMGGVTNLRWRAANIKGKMYLDKWVENVPEENQ
jgi:hypothetical protein